MKIQSMLGAGLIALLGTVAMTSTAHAQTTHPRVQSVNHRLHNQQDRIRQGVKSGELTPHEAQVARAREEEIRELRNRKLRNGHLSISETRRLNTLLNQSSNRIYQQKHDRNVRH